MNRNMGREHTLREHGHFWDAVTADAAPLGEARALIGSLLALDEIAGRDVLDAGCGAGDYAAAFAELGARRVAGIDLSAGSLSRARHKAPGLHLAAASLGALPFPAAHFHVIWTWGVLHYAPDARAALRELVRALRPGGVLVVHTLRAGFWASFERAAARLLSRTPRPVQAVLLGGGVRVLSLAVRLAGKRTQSASTTKTLRQKVHERFFVPGPVAA
ncbi:MAG: class I SAM-dependent methyltransferase, partial [Anaerolineae bacterium]|nr:class I SAM-dependent methyltransferase [Anaerolineae bacterium]